MSFFSYLPWWAYPIMFVLLLPFFALCACIAGKAIELRDDYQWASFLQREAVKTRRLLIEAREAHRFAPSHESRLLVMLCAARRDLIAAAQAEDWEKARTFKHQLATIQALLNMHGSRPVEPVMDWAHRERVRAAIYN